MDNFKEHPELMSRKKRPEHWDHKGEAPWTNVDPHGHECNSSAAHIVGFMFNYATVQEFNKGANAKRKNRGFVNWDSSLEPPIGRPPSGGTWDSRES